MISDTGFLEQMQRRILHQTTYLGVPTQKNPLDLWVYQEIIVELRPDVVIEIGNAAGGALLYLADVCDGIRSGRVFGVDPDRSRLSPKARNHPRTWLFTGNAVVQFQVVCDRIGPRETALVIEDSSHTYANTLSCLRLYSQLVKPGGYYVVEDTICHHGLDAGPDPGPYEAVQAFLAEAPDFEADRTRESFGLTWNPGGFLRRRSVVGSLSMATYREV